MRITLMSGAGNRFAMLDGFAGALPNDLPALARAACAEIDVGQGARPDGLLIATKPSKGGACAMVLHNADGSRPETCGNGLRCVAKLVADRGHVKGDAFVIESDAANCPTTTWARRGSWRATSESRSPSTRDATRAVAEIRRSPGASLGTLVRIATHPTRMTRTSSSAERWSTSAIRTASCSSTTSARHW